MLDQIQFNNTTNQYKKSNNEEVLPLLNLQNHSFSVAENTNHNRIELHLRGEFPSPEKVADEISTLYQYSEQYGTLLIYINSPGGHLNTLIELLSAIEKFDNVITVGCGDVASAGFILWCSGDVRVVQPYTMFMAHRESYGNIGKTDQHIEHAKHINEIGTRIIEDKCGNVLTDEELERCKYTEVFFSDESLLDREVCISWEQFVVNDTEPVEWNMYFTKNGVDYHVVGENHVMFEIDGVQYVGNFFDVVYDVPRPVIMEVSEEDIVSMLEQEDDDILDD